MTLYTVEEHETETVSSLEALEQGDIIKIRGDAYIIAQVDRDFFCPIRLDNGNRFIEPVETIERLRSELEHLTNNDGFYGTSLDLLEDATKIELLITRK